MKTISEKLFENYCKINKVLFEPIPAGLDKTPDYRLSINNHLVIVEIKQIDPNESDKASAQKREKGEVVVESFTPGSRIRKQITKASPQLKKHAKGLYPAILIIYNNVMSLHYTTSYDVLTGMYGLQKIIVGLPHNSNEEPYIKGQSFGPKKKVTPDTNTTLSALCILEKKNGNEIHLVVYHNIHASIPLDKNIMRMSNTRQFSLKEIDGKISQEWLEV